MTKNIKVQKISQVVAFGAKTLFFDARRSFGLRPQDSFCRFRDKN